MWLVSQSSSGLLTVPFEYVAVVVGLLVTGGLLYLANRYFDGNRR